MLQNLNVNKAMKTNDDTYCPKVCLFLVCLGVCYYSKEAISLHILNLIHCPWYKMYFGFSGRMQNISLTFLCDNIGRFPWVFGSNLSSPTKDICTDLEQSLHGLCDPSASEDSGLAQSVSFPDLILRQILS